MITLNLYVRVFTEIMKVKKTRKDRPIVYSNQFKLMIILIKEFYVFTSPGILCLIGKYTSIYSISLTDESQG